MKKIYHLIAAAVIFIGTQASAQDGFDQLIKSSPGDATKLVDAYATPLFRGFGTGLNTGWNNTAKTKGLLHFDLRITATGAFVPKSDASFDVNSLGLSSHLTVDGSSPTSIAPTIGGDKTAALPILRINNDAGTKIGQFTLPKAQTTIIPAPSVQLTVGLIANTDLTIRTVPKINFGSDIGSVGMIGFGLKHNFTGSGLASTMPFDLALAFNYNRLNYSKTLSVQPASGTTVAPGTTNTDYSNQHIDADFTGVNIQAIFSKKLAFFTPFIAAAYETANTHLAVLGNYPVTSSSGISGVSGSFYTTISDPVTIDEKAVSGMRGDIGFQLNLAIFRIYASAGVGKYKTVNGGIGFGF